MRMIIEPRDGDAEDDASSTKKRSLVAIAGSLLGEISLPKLVLSWILVVLLPGLLLGVAPLLLGAWISSVSGRIAALAGIGPLLVLALVAAIGWYGFRPLFRIAEYGFWSLNALAVQPGYALCREGLRHLAESFMPAGADQTSRARLRAASAYGAGLLCFLLAGFLILRLWPATRWTGSLADLVHPLRLVRPSLANTVTVMAAYFGIASLLWGVADGSMDQPLDLAGFGEAPEGARRWRVAHLSDIHVVGERYGFRIESGRAGPRGNERLARVLARLEEIHAAAPLDLLLITGDMTDAGRSAEWGEFLDAIQAHGSLAERTLILPGNHDVNIADRANPARLELPTSPGKRLRQMRTLSAADAVQGRRVQVFDASRTKLGGSLAAFLEPHREKIAAFADTGGLRLSSGLSSVWTDAFPMVLPPDGPEGLGVVLLNSNAETHFSFTNALGLVSEEDIRAALAVIDAFPRAGWILALHHHPVEYPKPAKAFSERIGTALINGSHLVRMLKRVAPRVVAMHGHRHIDWIGRCGAFTIVSAPSPVMEATDRDPTHFYIHTLAVGGGRLALLEPERIDIVPQEPGPTA
ncbi:metallophosphoesterase [Enterovirga sp.]|uniref:metallophosphoesterase family protein n=1 Tax=Enterovirga sp. TaxID=2026350 RepID=UPI002C6BF212|nr:metallophosphoesterase [Enterovirga sp.]HMO30166.1 metallophosphoesterase [Enterovirga sp.]